MENMLGTHKSEERSEMAAAGPGPLQIRASPQPTPTSTTQFVQMQIPGPRFRVRIHSEDMESAFLKFPRSFSFSWTTWNSLKDFSSGTRNLTQAMTVRALDSNHWTTRELPSWVILCGIFQKQSCRGTHLDPEFSGEGRH